MNQNKKCLEYLAELYPTREKAATEIINLQSIINLPKGTEHFISDIHGEYEAFSHVIRNGSGAVRKKINEVFGHTLGTAEKQSLATLIYYPAEKLEQIKKEYVDIDNWYSVTLYRLIEICKTVSSKYTRSKVRKMIPEGYAYVIEELITEKREVKDKENYYEAIIHTILEIGRAEDFIIVLSELIQRLVIEQLHIIGDIFDRGPLPHRIMDFLMAYHSVDIQWGNHDVLWMGAATGHPACVATVIRICLCYNNLEVLEDGYGINMVPLATFALEEYRDDHSECFVIKQQRGRHPDSFELERKMHKAITMMLFKLEGQIIKENPSFKMDKRLLLDKVNYENQTVEVEGEIYQMRDTDFPTVDREHPYELNEKEKEVMEKLCTAFRQCDKLRKHVAFLLKQGSLYKICNKNLLFHGCMPMNEDGSLRKVNIYEREYKGKALYDIIDHYVRKAFFGKTEEEIEKGGNLIWYLWCAPDSPLFGRDKMATFERYFIEDSKCHKEEKDVYYKLIDNEEMADLILKEFDLSSEDAHIINGHVPVHQNAGESPIKCGGKLLIIDGGFSKPYHKKTGIAGYTLIYNSYGLFITAHEPFESKEAGVKDEKDIMSRQFVVKYNAKRQLVGDTDKGKVMKKRIKELKELITAYQTGEIKEREYVYASQKDFNW